MLNVTELSMYLYCPRQFYLQKVLGVKKPVNKEMMEGRILHEILENFSNSEEEVIKEIETFDKEKILEKFSFLLEDLKNFSFLKNKNIIEKFSINQEELENKANKLIEKEILIRLPSIEETAKKGFFKEKLWENLSPKYFSEFPLISEKLQLKGRVDRIMFSENMIVPFELKTRNADKVYDSDEIQLAAYSLLLEEKFQKPINLGILEAGNKKHEVIISKEAKEKVIKLTEEIHSLLLPPSYPSNFSKCQNCSLKEECDKLVKS
jgi:CRISPR-associated protein Cas4